MAKYEKNIKALEDQGLKMRAGQGMNLAQLAKLVQTSKSKNIINDVTTVLNNIFPGVKGLQKISNALIKDTEMARKLYGQASLQYYLQTKRAKGDLSGILFINMGKKTYTFIESVQDVINNGFGLEISTAYVLALKDPSNNPYPQIGLST
jgi:hypothetical protein